MANKKKFEGMLKMSFYNETNKMPNKKNLTSPKKNGSFRNSIMQVDHDEDEFINFVRQITNLNHQN